MLLLSQDKITRERSNRLGIGRPKNYVHQNSKSREFLILKFCLDSDDIQVLFWCYRFLFNFTSCFSVQDDDLELSQLCDCLEIRATGMFNIKSRMPMSRSLREVLQIINVLQLL